MHSETTDSYRRVSFCLLMVLSLGRKSSYPASDCCQLTRYDLLNEREIAKALIDNDITSHMPTYHSKSHCDSNKLWLCRSTRSSGAARFLTWEMDRVLAILRGPAGL